MVHQDSSFDKSLWIGTYSCLLSLYTSVERLCPSSFGIRNGTSFLSALLLSIIYLFSLGMVNSGLSFILWSSFFYPRSGAATTSSMTSFLVKDVKMGSNTCFLPFRHSSNRRVGNCSFLDGRKLQSMASTPEDSFVLYPFLSSSYYRKC